VDRVQREALQRDLARLADGDRDAFHPVFVRLWPLVRGFVGRHVPPGEADDAAQEALVKVFARAAQFDPQRDALTWALTLAAYEIKTIRRRHLRRREAARPADDVLAGTADPAAGPEEIAMRRQREDAVAAALALLRPEDEATLRAYMTEEPPDVPGATFRKRVQRALLRLRTLWSTSHGRP
jgi:RNA polymerase sigma-70 factor (ECF subfamily)